MNKKQTPKRKGLSGKELIAKHDTGKKVDFNSAIKAMCETPSHFSKAKNSNSGRYDKS
jgi:hypothetical protein